MHIQSQVFQWHVASKWRGKTLVPWWNLNIEAGKPMSDVGPSNGLATKGTSSSVRTTSSLLLKKMFVVKSKAEIWKVWNATPRWMVTIFPSHWIWCDDVIHRAIDWSSFWGGVDTLVYRASRLDQVRLSSGNQTWLAGKSTIFTADFPTTTSIYIGCSLAMFDYQRVGGLIWSYLHIPSTSGLQYNIV
jgi:hypothetical protein